MGWFSWVDPFQLAREAVNAACGQLTSVLGQVTDFAINPLNGIVKSVVGGNWVGDGADAFVQELQTIAIPGAGAVGGHVQFFNANLVKAVEIMDEADKAVQGIANGLGDLFGSIF